MNVRGAVWLACACVTGGCGYRAVYAAPPGERMHVALVRTLVADAATSDEVVDGVREELARAGALAPGEGYPRAEVEVLRIEEGSEAIAVGDHAPIARGVDLGVVARAWIVRAPGGSEEQDTGDIRAGDVVTVDTTGAAGSQPSAGGAATLDPRAAVFHDADARRSAARRLGRKLGSVLLGLPAASEDALRGM